MRTIPLATSSSPPRVSDGTHVREIGIADLGEALAKG